MNKQAIIDAAVECFDLGPEDQDAALRFGLRLEGMDPPDPDAHITDQERFSERESAEQRAEERYPMPLFENHLHLHTTDAALAYSVVGARQEGYAAALTERAIPAETALRLAIDYIRAVRSRDIDHMQRIARTLEALRANPLAAKMLEE